MTLRHSDAVLSRCHGMGSFGFHARGSEIVLLTLALLTSGCTAGSTLESNGAPPPDERADYDWAIREPGGAPFMLAEFRGRVLFINMWASWCTPCVAEMAGIQGLRDSLAGSGVEFLLISPEEAEPVERFLRRYGYDLPVYLEIERMPDAFGLRALPTTYIIDTDGRIMLKHRGGADWNSDAARQLLLRLVAGG